MSLTLAVFATQAGCDAHDGAELSPCVASQAEQERLENMYTVVGESVHEMIVCGKAQFDLMATLVPQVLASNQDLIRPEVRDFLALDPPPFTSDGHGLWVMEPARNTEFSVEFLRPDAAPDASAIEGDLFRLDAYFSGVRVTRAPTGLDFLRSPNGRHDFSFTWDAPGPLADLLPPDALAAGEITLSLNRHELVDLFECRGGSDSLPDIGPFRALLRLPVRSRVVVQDELEGIAIAYAARGPADEAGDLLSGGHVPFVFDTLEATDGDGLSLSGVADGLYPRDRWYCGGDLRDLTD